MITMTSKAGNFLMRKGYVEPKFSVNDLVI